MCVRVCVFVYIHERVHLNWEVGTFVEFSCHAACRRVSEVPVLESQTPSVGAEHML